MGSESETKTMAVKQDQHDALKLKLSDLFVALVNTQRNLKELRDIKKMGSAYKELEKVLPRALESLRRDLSKETGKDGKTALERKINPGKMDPDLRKRRAEVRKKRSECYAKITVAEGGFPACDLAYPMPEK